MATTTAPIASTTAHLGWNQALGVAGATLAAVAVWILAIPVLGTALVVQFGDGAPQTIGIELVTLGSLTGSLLGLGALFALEKFTSRARMIWTAVAIGVLLVSLSLPLVAGTTASAKAALALMHLAVASVLIPALRHRPSHSAFPRR
jgi:hypothetical protein